MKVIINHNFEFCIENLEWNELYSNPKDNVWPLQWKVHVDYNSFLLGKILYHYKFR